MSSEQIKVIVIGSGIAGLAASYELHQKGFQVTILEARSTHGGRISKNTTFADFALETGAEEIHVEESRYYEMAKEVGAIIEPDDAVEHYIEDLPSKDEKDINKGNGILVEREEYFDKYDREDLYDQIIKEENQKILKDDMSIAQYLKEKNDDPRFLKFYEFIWGTEYGTTIEEMSIKGYAEHEQGWESDHDVNFLVRNMSHFDIIEKNFASVLPFIKYNTPVTNITINENNEIKSVKIIDNKGNEYHANHVIIAVPISQLKNGSITFNPSLPEEKQKAISLIQMGRGGKLHMRFKERFWPEKLGSLFLRCGIGMVWNCSYNRSEKSFVLCALISGKVADDMNDEQKRKNLMSELFLKLKEVYKVEKDIEKELFEDYIWTDYATMKYIEGNYTYPALNLGQYREILAQPIDNILFFAGEASNPKYFSTINGAQDTGIREAQRIISLYNQI